MGWNGSRAGIEPAKAMKKPGRGQSGGLFVWGLAVVVVIAVVACVVILLPSEETSKKMRPHVETATVQPRPSRNPNRPKSVKPKSSVEVDQLSGQDRKWAEAIQAALDDNDWERTLKAATEAMASTNAEVRLNAVDALGWFGAPALPELVGAMGDADEDVRQAAGNHFESALQEVEKPSERFGIAMSAFGAIRSEDQLTSLGGVVASAANEFIDGEEDEQKAAQNRTKVIKALAKQIESGKPENAQAAREAFNDITGNEWRGVDEANRYLADPENYEFDPES